MKDLARCPDSMRKPKHFYVYIITNNQRIARTLHRNHRRPAPPRKRAQTQTLSLGFTSHYNLTRLVYCEVFSYPGDAIAREKEIKGWVRSKKIKLIESINPNWHDLAAD